MMCELHARLGHMNVDNLKGLLRQGLIKGVEVINLNEDFECRVCILAKKSRKPVLASCEGKWKTALGEEIHLDVWGLAPVKTLGSWYYYVSFTDDWNCWTTAYLMYTKSEVFECYKSFATWVKTQLGVKIKCLHSDRGGEYLSHEFINFLDQRGMERKLTFTIPPRRMVLQNA
jgi:hypothetical protein